MATVRVVLLVAVVVAVGGCAAMSESWDELFGDPSAPTPVADATEGSDVFYARIEGLEMYALPTGTSEIVARLSLHQRVLRIGLARGYANVSTDAGITGWVDNTELLWRLPSAPVATEAPGAPVAPSGAETAAPAAYTPEAVTPVAEITATSEPVATPFPALETPEPTVTAEVPATSTPAPSPTRKRNFRAIFDW